MTELTEFLLARIAEDVKWARARRDEDFRKHRVSVRRPHLAPDDAERVLAQCAAYRGIVDRATRVIDNPETYDQTARDIAEDALLELARIYADHPECREEWKL